jgi:hypothetical protein
MANGCIVHMCVLENRIGGAEKGGAPASLQENNVLNPRPPIIIMVP